MNTRYMLICGAITGTLAALLTVTPIASIVNCLVCGWLWIAGIAAVWMYRANTGEVVAPRGGIILGLVAGAFGAVVATLLTALTGIGASPIPAEQLAQIEEQLGPDAVEMIRMIASPGGSLTISLLVNVVVYPLFGLIGGLIGASIFKNRPIGQGPA